VVPKLLPRARRAERARPELGAAGHQRRDRCGHRRRDSHRADHAARLLAGACLASEFVARNPRRYGGLAALSGGLIGEAIDPDDYLENDPDLEDTPVFLGCSDVDPHIPEERVHETADVLESMNADVTKRLYEGMGHGINEDEMAFVSGMVAALVDD